MGQGAGKLRFHTNNGRVVSYSIAGTDNRLPAMMIGGGSASLDLFSDFAGSENFHYLDEFDEDGENFDEEEDLDEEDFEDEYDEDGENFDEDDVCRPLPVVTAKTMLVEFNRKLVDVMNDLGEDEGKDKRFAVIRLCVHASRKFEEFKKSKVASISAADEKTFKDAISEIKRRASSKNLSDFSKEEIIRLATKVEKQAIIATTKDEAKNDKDNILDFISNTEQSATNFIQKAKKIALKTIEEEGAKISKCKTPDGDFSKGITVPRARILLEAVANRLKKIYRAKNMSRTSYKRALQFLSKAQNALDRHKGQVTMEMIRKFR